MLNISSLENKFAGLVRFKQPYNPAYAIIDADNLAGRSGETVNDNPFVKIEAIKDSQDYADISDANFNLFLKDKLKTATVNTLNAVFNEPDFIDRKVLYPNATNKTTYADLLNGFNGYKISIAKEDVAINISRIMLEFYGTGNITIVLFNSANPNVSLYSKVVNVTTKFHEEQLGWILDNSQGKGYLGEYYLGYFSSGVTLKPYERNYSNASVMDNVCFLDIELINFPAYTSLGSAFDATATGTPLVSNGINLDISVCKDYTDFAIQNENLFARAINLQAQILLLSESVASISSNRNERISSNYAGQVMTQIEGEDGENNVKVKGLRPQFFGAIASIRKEINKMQTAKLGIGQIKVGVLC